MLLNLETILIALQQHVSKRVRGADMRQYEQYVDGLGRLFTDLTQSRDEDTRGTQRTPQRQSVTLAVATPAVNTPNQGWSVTPHQTFIVLF